MSLDRAIGSADKLAGTLPRKREIAKRGADRIERSEKLLTAARLEQEAATRREQARAVAAGGRREAARKRKAAQDRAISGLEEADAADAKKQAAHRVMKAELHDARETKQSAAEASSDAERLSDLTEAKKQERKRGVVRRPPSLRGRSGPARPVLVQIAERGHPARAVFSSRRTAGPSKHRESRRKARSAGRGEQE